MTSSRIHFKVEAVDCVKITSFGGADCRTECASELLVDLVQNAPEYFVGRSGGVWFCDKPPDREWVLQNDLSFCSTKHAGQLSPCLPFPCPMFLRWPQVGIPNAEELMRTVLAEDATWEDERIFWIGANTHPVRLALASLVAQHPDLLDVELMEWDRQAIGDQRSKTRQVSIPDHRKYKYLIDCPGYGYSARIKWLLATGRPLFIVERDIVEHWHEEMQPWVHFVPVAKDLSNLFEHRARLEADPGLYEDIRRQARAFAAERLTVEARLRDVLEAMDRRFATAKCYAAATNIVAAPKCEAFQIVTPPSIGEIVDILQYFLSTKDEYLWTLDERVWYGGEWNAFQSSFNHCKADFLATYVRTQHEEPEWHGWANLRDPASADAPKLGVAALLPLMRMSRAAAKTMLEGIAEGWTGHPEALIPTLVNCAGLKIEDIGGMGSFTPPDRIGQWYGRQTWSWQGPVEQMPEMLHFPVPRQKRALAPRRITNWQAGIHNCEMKMLYVSPVGGGARELLPEVLQCFLAAGADCLLLQYDEADLAIPDGVRLIKEQGHKWQLALRHLSPDMVSSYDFIFFWDDDLKVRNFEPTRFAKIMRTNRLDMAQPAIQSPHGLSHAITKYRPCPPPWRDPDGITEHPVVGRLTNFVEIMAPVFTRDAWREFHGYLDPDNRSGWGYDYIPLGRKGIVDAMPVTHTRAVQSITGSAQMEIARFLQEQGLFNHTHVQQGWLFE